MQQKSIVYIFLKHGMPNISLKTKLSKRDIFQYAERERTPVEDF